MKATQLTIVRSALSLAFVAIFCLPLLAQQLEESTQTKAKRSRVIKPIKSERRPAINGASGLASPQVVARALSMIQGNAPVMKETQLLDYQLEQIKEIRYELQKSLGEAAKTTAKATGQEKRDAFNKIYADAHKQLGDALLPEQRDRLLQVALQSFGISNLTGEADLANLVGHPVVQSELHLSATKIQEIRKKMLAENKRVAEELEKLKKQAQKNVLSVLSPEERSKLEGLVGEPFDFKGYQPGRRGRFTKGDDH